MAFLAQEPVSVVGVDELFDASKASRLMRQHVQPAPHVIEPAGVSWKIQILGAVAFVGMLVTSVALTANAGPGPLVTATATAALGSAAAVLFGRRAGVAGAVSVGAFVTALQVVAPVFPSASLTLLLSAVVALEVGRR